MIYGFEAMFFALIMLAVLAALGLFVWAVINEHHDEDEIYEGWRDE